LFKYINNDILNIKILVMKKTRFYPLLILTSIILGSCAQKETSPELPETCYDLLLKAPITTWDEAIPLGNGLMGGLLWGENNIIRLSLDRGDLWDERTHGSESWWKEHTFSKGAELVSQKEYTMLNNWWDDPYNGVTPTKLPAGRIEIKLPESKIARDFELHLANAEGIVRFNSDLVIKVMYSATEPVALLLVKGVMPDSVSLLSTMDVYRKSIAENVSFDRYAKTMDKLSYPEAEKGVSGSAQWYIQEAAEGLKYCVYTKSKQIDNETLFAITITSSGDASDILSLALNRCTTALQKGYDSIMKAHSIWWKNFWQKSSVDVPDTAIQKQYNLYNTSMVLHPVPMRHLCRCKVYGLQIMVSCHLGKAITTTISTHR
jgi:alpha-L-fucosidase 2